MDHSAAHAVDPAHIDTSTGLDSRKMAFWTFIGAECLLFGSLIATYMAYKGDSIAGPCPHPGMTLPNGTPCGEGILDVPLTSLSTFVLLMSSLTMVLGLAGVQRGDRRLGTLWLGATAFLGAIFLGFQSYEFTHFWHHGLTLSSNLFGSSFYMLTGFHGAHVTIGAIMLAVMLGRSMRGHFTPENHFAFEAAAWYWHFVDVVWLLLFVLVYWL